MSYYRKKKTKTANIVQFYDHGSDVGVYMEFEPKTGKVYVGGHWGKCTPIQARCVTIFELFRALGITPALLKVLARNKRRRP